MKEPISSYEEYCRVWAEVYKKHAKHSERTVFSCYVRGGIKNALNRGELRKPKQEVTTDEDIIGIYIVRALVAQGMRESAILDYTEQMQDYVSGQVHTQHTTELVPFIYVGPTQATIAEGGVLADVAPTLLSLMNLPVPQEMQGKNLITLQ